MYAKRMGRHNKVQGWLCSTMLRNIGREMPHIELDEWSGAGSCPFTIRKFTEPRPASSVNAQLVSQDSHLHPNTNNMTECLVPAFGLEKPLGTTAPGTKKIIVSIYVHVKYTNISPAEFYWE